MQIYLRASLRLIAAKFVTPTKELVVEEFYAEHKDEGFFPQLVTFMTSGSFVALWLRGERAVEKVRSLNGSTDPAKAAEGTIRRLYGRGCLDNAVHGSSSEESAKREIPFFFPSYPLSPPRPK